MRIIKKQGKTVNAYCLGETSTVIDKLIETGKIKMINDTTFEVFSQECKGDSGEIAHLGDYIKVDSSGYPYPNEKAYFEENHIYQGEDLYEQIPKPLLAWTAEETICPEVQFLIKNKKLIIDENSVDKYFSAELWGTVLSAAKNAVVVFYSINKDGKGHVADVDFNLIACDEFEKTYNVLP